MTKMKTNNLIRNIASLDEDQQRRLRISTDDELPKLLQEFGISLPSSSWWLRIIKIILYGLGIVLAGLGTSAAAQTLF